MRNSLSHDVQFSRIQCRACGKWAYTSRKAARRVMRTVHIAEPGVNVYRCPTDSDQWHVGHLTRRVDQGVTTRHE